MSFINVGDCVIVRHLVGKRHWGAKPQFLRATVTALGWRFGGESLEDADYFDWKCGRITNRAYKDEENIKWIRGWGTRARAALEAVQRLIK